MPRVQDFLKGSSGTELRGIQASLRGTGRGSSVALEVRIFLQKYGDKMGKTEEPHIEFLHVAVRY